MPDNPNKRGLEIEKDKVDRIMKEDMLQKEKFLEQLIGKRNNFILNSSQQS